MNEFLIFKRKSDLLYLDTENIINNSLIFVEKINNNSDYYLLLQCNTKIYGKSKKMNLLRNLERILPLIKTDCQININNKNINNNNSSILINSQLFQRIIEILNLELNNKEDLYLNTFIKEIILPTFNYISSLIGIDLNLYYSKQKFIKLMKELILNLKYLILKFYY